MAALPLTFTAFGQQCAASLRQALGDGHCRITLDVQTFLKTSPALLKPVLGSIPKPWVGIFGTGNSGLGDIEWGKGQGTLLDSGEALEYLPRLSWDLMLVMDASSIEMPRMQELLKIADSKPLVMVNCWPEAPGVLGIGRGQETLRRAVREQLTVAYYLQAYRFQPLVIYRAYPGPWQLWQIASSQPSLLAEQPEPFTPAQLQTLARTQPWVDFGERWSAFWSGPRYFREWK